MTTKEVTSKNRNHLRRTVVELDNGERYVVSTVVLDSLIKQMDGALIAFGDMFGISNEDIERFDPSTPGDYETMVFPSDEDGNALDYTELDFARYDSEDLAIEGHNVMVNRWKEKN